MTIYLLDVNVLLALCDGAHAQHEAAHRWFARHGHNSWATCPITENGFVRIASHPNYPNKPGEVGDVMEILRQFCATEGHNFWPDDITLRDELASGALVPSSQITDVYLLALAIHKDGKLATFDQRITTTAIRKGTTGIETIRS